MRFRLPTRFSRRRPPVPMTEVRDVSFGRGIRVRLSATHPDHPVTALFAEALDEAAREFRARRAAR